VWILNDVLHNNLDGLFIFATMKYSVFHVSYERISIIHLNCYAIHHLKIHTSHLNCNHYSLCVRQRQPKMLKGLHCQQGRLNQGNHL
jgi:hypothetical protein